MTIITQLCAHTAKKRYIINVDVIDTNQTKGFKMSDKKVVGFQHWLNGEEAGYGSVERIFGVPAISEQECWDEGYIEGAGVTFVYED